MKLTKTLVPAVAGFLLAGAASAADLWLHVKVTERTGEKANVNVNLPLSLAGKALPMIPEDLFKDGQIHFDDHQVTVQQLREMWNELQRQPSFVIASVEKDNEQVRVTKEKDHLMVFVEEQGNGGARVKVRVPSAVVDALLSGSGNQLDLRAALATLAAQGAQELVSVEEEDSQVRVWIDHQVEAR